MGEKKRNGKCNDASLRVKGHMSNARMEVARALRRGSSDVAILDRLDRMEREVVTELRDYQWLEHVIESKADSAVRKVDIRLVVIGLVVTCLISFGVRPLASWYEVRVRERVTKQLVLDEVSRTIARRSDEIAQVRVSTAVAEIRNEFMNVVSNEVLRIEEQSKSLVADMEAVSEFFTTVSMARAGDRKSYDALVGMMHGENRFGKAASGVVTEIREKYLRRKYEFGGMRRTLKGVKDSAMLSREQRLITLVRLDREQNCDGALMDLDECRAKRYVSTFVRAMQNTARLETMFLAIRAIEHAAARDFSALGSDEVLAWWNSMAMTDRTSYRCDYEDYLDSFDDAMFPRRENESLRDYSWRRIEAMYAKMNERDDSFAIASELAVSAIFMNAEPETMARRKQIASEALSYYGRMRPLPERWCQLKALYLGMFGEMNELVSFLNERLKESPGLEGRLKEWQVFTPSFFEMDEINWPSRAHRPTTTSAIAEAKTPSRSIENPGVVGMIEVKLCKGKRELFEIPYGDDSDLCSKLSSLQNGAVEGDIVSWTRDGRREEYGFDEGAWHDSAGTDASNVIVPVGRAVITYERTADVSTTLTLVGSFRAKR